VQVIKVVRKLGSCALEKLPGITHSGAAAPYGICNDILGALPLVLGLTLINIHCAMVGRIQFLDSFLIADAQKRLR